MGHLINTRPDDLAALDRAFWGTIIGTVAFVFVISVYAF